jgi:hypothetical protein
MGSWRAGCGESRTSGSEGGSRKRTGRKVGTAPRPDPYRAYTNALRKAALARKAAEAEAAPQAEPEPVAEAEPPAPRRSRRAKVQVEPEVAEAAAG